jgi:hypothetical protein
MLVCRRNKYLIWFDWFEKWLLQLLIYSIYLILLLNLLCKKQIISSLPWKFRKSFILLNPLRYMWDHLACLYKISGRKRIPPSARRGRLELYGTCTVCWHFMYSRYIILDRKGRSPTAGWRWLDSRGYVFWLRRHQIVEALLFLKMIWSVDLQIMRKRHTTMPGREHSIMDHSGWLKSCNAPQLQWILV